MTPIESAEYVRASAENGIPPELSDADLIDMANAFIELVGACEAAKKDMQGALRFLMALSKVYV